MIKKILLLIAFVAVFAAGVALASIMHFGSPVVDISFINKSGKDITAIEINHEVGRFGEIRHQIADLHKGQDRQIRIWAPAESSYNLIVTFADKGQLTGGQGYIQPGYKITEIINSDKIESDATAFGNYKP
jgi:hypothetical protein